MNKIYLRIGNCDVSELFKTEEVINEIEELQAEAILDELATTQESLEAEQVTTEGAILAEVRSVLPKDHPDFESPYHYKKPKVELDYVPPKTPEEEIKKPEVPAHTLVPKPILPKPTPKLILDYLAPLTDAEKANVNEVIIA